MKTASGDPVAIRSVVRIEQAFKSGSETSQVARHTFGLRLHSIIQRGRLDSVRRSQTRPPAYATGGYAADDNCRDQSTYEQAQKSQDRLQYRN